MHTLGAAVNLALYATHVGIPDCVASSMRMADIVSKMYAFAANITLCHDYTSLTSNPAIFSQH
jgi:hypothetical protein